MRRQRARNSSVVGPLDAETVDAAVATVRARGMQSDHAVGLLHADMDGASEQGRRRRAARRDPGRRGVALVGDRPGVPPSASAFPRRCSTPALAPIVQAYLDRVARGVRAAGVQAPIFVMRSDGGMAALKSAWTRPATLIESGPASGIMSAAYVGRALGIANVLSYDMGSTSAKAGTVFGGVPEISASFEAAGSARSGRSVKGSGYPVQFPFVDLAEVSAGGGTIAWVDAAGALRVSDRCPRARIRGPRATAPATVRPSPMRTSCCAEWNPRALLGGAFAIDAERSRSAIASVAAPLGGDVERAAAGIVALVDAEMAKVLAASCSVERHELGSAQLHAARLRRRRAAARVRRGGRHRRRARDRAAAARRVLRVREIALGVRHGCGCRLNADHDYRPSPPRRQELR